MRLAVPIVGGFFAAAMLAGCATAGNTGTQDHDPYLAINTLLLANGCSSCHAADYVRLGPAVTDVAALYAQATDEELEAVRQNITAGVRGKWGTPIMPPQHQIRPERAREILDTILSLNAHGNH